jgi:hypothetical protein
MSPTRTRTDPQPPGFARRLTIWLFAWVTALIGTGLIIGDPLAIDLAPWFPLGLFFFTGPGAASPGAERWLVVAGWLLYLVMAAVLLFVRGRRRYRVTLAVFSWLLLVNVAGCYMVTAR